MTNLTESFECQEYEELKTVEDAFALFPTNPQEWCFQLKYDGIWGKVVIENGYGEVYSKTGQLKSVFKVEHWLFPRKTIILLGEFMYGSQWAKHPDRTGLIYVFDCVAFDGEDISTKQYIQRKKIADNLAVELGGILRKTDLYAVDKLGEIWMNIESTMKYEGLIVRKRLTTYFDKLYKLKTEVEDDYVVMGWKEGQGKLAGKLGALAVGQYINGVLTYIMDVGGGMSDEQREKFFRWATGAGITGMIARVKGKLKFSSGAMRGPQFVNFRSDKKAEDCICTTS